MSKPKLVTEATTHAALASLSEESDRGAAVLAGSMVENALGQYLEHHCRSYASAPTIERLFGSTGPISTFSQRILIAAAFGLISKTQQRQLDYIRDIRNYFSHHPEHATFSDPQVLAIFQPHNTINSVFVY